MVFSSMIFLCGFLPAVLIIYYLCPAKIRNFFLLVASLLFYAWGEPRYIWIMIFSMVFDYGNGRALEYLDRKHRLGARKAVLVLSVVGNIGILSFFKYTDFMLDTINAMSGGHIPLLELALPIGISFYTFQTLSYTIDVYRHQVPAQKNLIAFGMYVCLFPQLIAGPIVRYHDIQNQINSHRLGARRCGMGMQRFLIGLGKKVLLANQMGALWDDISSLQGNDLSVCGAWLGAIAFTFQIYFDFSGYSDMAIGLGEMLGFTFPENFNYPYESKSITEFWRRWHISLGTWFREYLYIPLGGNRYGMIRQIFNLLVVWFLTGLWHGAGWNFILWGLYFFVLLLIEKLYLLKQMQNWPAWLQHVYALFFIVFGWAIFACDDMSLLARYIRAMFGIGVTGINDIAIYYLATLGVFMVVLAVGCLQLPKNIANRMCKWLAARFGGNEQEIAVESVTFILKSIFCLIILGISLCMLVSGSYNPFLYFRF